jgi:hypothetical protein
LVDQEGKTGVTYGSNYITVPVVERLSISEAVKDGLMEWPKKEVEPPLFWDPYRPEGPPSK